ncbi:hypothetical protein [Muribaculum gordoncarteri]|jgi:hypothetical protein|uniref:Uncharacterized protein n=1 Tax=Muribaculum gordoncarteri TaxID=2530390 RepID=A0A4P7VDB5_9BACT|nr:hypothetical protein [Muribaculum gordoncarteri]QCD34524.1 hypothetical protein E7746_00815 [Muribaculum gordoncarteri]
METTPDIQDPEVNDTPVPSIDNASSTVDLSEIVARDPRAAHFIVDLLAGVEAGEAASRHFSTPPPPPDESLILEAENRGYLRGRNESAAEIMKSPGMYQQPHSPDSTLPAPHMNPNSCSSRRAAAFGINQLTLLSTHF